MGVVGDRVTGTELGRGIVAPAGVDGLLVGFGVTERATVAFSGGGLSGSVCIASSTFLRQIRSDDNHSIHVAPTSQTLQE